MTKTQLSVRIAPETLTAIDAEARRLGVSRGHVVDRWLSAQAATVNDDTHESVINALASAYGLIARAEYGNTDMAVINAMRYLADAINTLADTAPDNSPACGRAFVRSARTNVQHSLCPTCSRQARGQVREFLAMMTSASRARSSANLKFFAHS